MNKIGIAACVLCLLVIVSCQNAAVPANEATPRLETPIPAQTENQASGQPAKVEQPDHSPPAADESVDVLGELRLTVQSTDKGFRLAHNDEFGFYVSQTLASPNIEGVSYAVHIVRRDSIGTGFDFRRDAVIVDPETAEYRVYPLYQATVEDMYNPDSVATAYGFIDDRRLLYVSVINDDAREAGYYYRIEALDIVTGEAEILLPDIPDVPMDDHFVPGWMTDDKKKLVLNSYRTGKWWTFDLRTKETFHPDLTFKHEWPFYLIAHSPDGQRFWYTDYEKSEYSLYDLSGRLLSSLSFGKGYDQYPPFQWSPDGRYSAYQDTFDQSEAHIIGDNGENFIVSPQRIRFFDREGKLARTIQTDPKANRYIEVVKWLEGEEGIVILHEYELERSPDQPASKVKSVYKRLDLLTGEEIPYSYKQDDPQSESLLIGGKWLVTEDMTYTRLE